MYNDPLNSTTSIFAPLEEESPWQTASQSPIVPSSSIHGADRAPPFTSALSSVDDGPAPGLYGKEPKIYGQPEPGLISPKETVGSNGTKFEKPEPYLRIRITGLDRNRRDILVRFDAQTNLTNFTGTTYRNVQRSYVEFQQFYDTIIYNNPHTIIAGLPLPQTSAPTDEEDDRLVKIMLQRWFTRVCEDPILLYDEDVRSFVESDFGYQPTPRPRRKAAASFGIIRARVPDEDEDLQRARFELTKLETQFFETAKAVDKLAIARKSLASAHIEMGNKLVNVATTEAHPPLANALRKLGRAWHSLADLGHAQSISECVVVGDSLGYQGMNARSARETLLMRNAVLEDYQAAVKTTVSKRKHIERLKASSNIRPERVDDAIEEMEEAHKYEQVLAKRADGISQNLHKALDTHNRYAHDDVMAALIEHARSSIMYERQLLRELEALRVDVAGAAKKVAPASIPKPTVILPLEEFAPPLHRPQLPPVDRGNDKNAPNFRNLPPESAGPVSAQAQSPRSALPSPIPPSQEAARQDPLASTLQPPPPHKQEPLSVTVTSPLPSDPLSPVSTGVSTAPVSALSSPGSLVPSPVVRPSEESPGNHLVDTPKSMIVKSAQLPTTPTAIVPALTTTLSPPRPKKDDPLQSDPLSRPLIPVTYDPSNLSVGADPLGQMRPQPLSPSASVRIQPTRPRLDPREAASKLANMF